VKKALLVGILACVGFTVQSPFDAAVSAFERAWLSGDADGIAGMLDPAGIRLQLGSESHARVAGRQARAAVAGFRDGRSGGQVELRQAAEVPGDPPRGSAEFGWRTVVQGTSEQVVYTIFVEMTRASEGWRISGIRVF
jgi:hypothetical protein